MASNSSHREDDYSCVVCCDIFKDPVLLMCSHSFCKACLHEWWRDKAIKECPLCKKRQSMDPPPNLALKNLCQAFVQERHQRASLKQEVLCRLHTEKLELFCLDCQQLACGVCQYSKRHTDHVLKSIDKAAKERKVDVQKLLEPLQEKLKVFNDVKANYQRDKTSEHIKGEARNANPQIKEQFKKMHQFLFDEEEARITALREEEQQKSQMMKEKIEGLNKSKSNISDTITAIEEELNAEHISFLQNYKTTVERLQLTLQDPQPVLGALINEAKHLGNLVFRVWDKMKDIVSYTPVILDPNTANPYLILFDGLTCMRRGDLQRLPHNPERFDCWWNVLGSEGFNGGTHSWDVEVRGNTKWELGVLAESFHRKGPRGGKRWFIEFYKGKYKAHCFSGLPTDLSLKRNPKKIRVQLDLEEGKLSFSDPDTNTQIYDFTHTFTETIIPFINTYDVLPLRMLPWKVNVTLEPYSQT